MDTNKLDLAFEFPTSWSNEIRVQDGNKTIVYRGLVFGLRFEGLDNVRGHARLSKMEVILVPKTKWEREKGQWLPRPVTVLGEKEKTIWSFDANQYSSLYFMYSGRTCSGTNCGANYRGGLAEESTKVGLILTKALLDQVFDPIDAKIREIRESIMRSGGIPSSS